ncbi:MAG: hypothetical protein JO157_17310 [Acetobacteraceae bacterium]|nr:hypothetical protein [Acetobacteraceae bacterium]
MVTRPSTDAEATCEPARQRTLRDLDAAALRLRPACAVLLNEAAPDAAVRAAAFEAVTPDALRAAGKPLLAAMPKGWRGEVMRDGGVDMAAYQACLGARPMEAVSL